MCTLESVVSVCSSIHEWKIVNVYLNSAQDLSACKPFAMPKQPYKQQQASHDYLHRSCHLCIVLDTTCLKRLPIRSDWSIIWILLYHTMQ